MAPDGKNDFRGKMWEITIPVVKCGEQFFKRKRLPAPAFTKF
jgi:hypothetical protein